AGAEHDERQPAAPAGRGNGYRDQAWSLCRKVPILLSCPKREGRYVVLKARASGAKHAVVARRAANRCHFHDLRSSKRAEGNPNGQGATRNVNLRACDVGGAAPRPMS